MKRQRNMFRKKENKTKPQKKELNKYKDRPITSKEIESVIKKPKETKKKQKNFQQTKVQDKNASQVNFTKHLKKS